MKTDRKRLLIHCVMPIADGCLRHLGQRGKGIAQQQMLQRPTAVEFLLELVVFQFR